MASSTPFECSITHDIMTDPYIDDEGNSYERSEIEKWLKNNDTSPITRSKLTMKQLRPNRGLKDAIDLYLLKENNDTVAVNGSSTDGSSTEEFKLTNPTAELKISKLVEHKKRSGKIMISITPPKTNSRVPINIICVVDVSGSMAIEASMTNESGQTETHGLSLLDIVKHAVKTIIHSLESVDTFSLVTFSNDAKCVIPLTKMTCKGKSKALTRVEGLKSYGMTNLWSGLLMAMNEMNRLKSKQTSSIFLLTDGIPNDSPPRGILGALQKYKREHQHNFFLRRNKKRKYKLHLTIRSNRLSRLRFNRQFKQFYWDRKLSTTRFFRFYRIFFKRQNHKSNHIIHGRPKKTKRKKVHRNL